MPKKSEDCQAAIILDGERFDGSTGKNCGHAEMNALDNLIARCSEHFQQPPSKVLDVAVGYIKGAKSKSVDCPSRPVCLQCGTVLKAMGFKVHGFTEWGNVCMGSTEWAASMNVRAVIDVFVSYDSVVALRKP